jgi:hypothetical protein
VSRYVGTSALLEAEVILLLELLHLLIPVLILPVYLLLHLRDLIALVLPALKEYVVSEELVSGVKLLLITVEPL